MNQYNDNEYELVRNGFSIDIEIPYKTIVFTLNSKFPNLESYMATTIYLLSRKVIRFFYFTTNFEMKNWDERSLNTRIEWTTSEHPLYNKENVVDSLRNIFSQLEKRAKDELEEKFSDQEKNEEFWHFHILSS